MDGHIRIDETDSCPHSHITINMVNLNAKWTFIFAIFVRSFSLLFAFGFVFRLPACSLICTQPKYHYMCVICINGVLGDSKNHLTNLKYTKQCQGNCCRMFWCDSFDIEYFLTGGHVFLFCSMYYTIYHLRYACLLGCLVETCSIFFFVFACLLIRLFALTHSGAYRPMKMHVRIHNVNKIAK